MYIIKEKPEDFIVEEIPIIKLKEEGRHSVFLMTKRGVSTQKAIEIIKRKLGLKNSQVGYAGSKDKNAITRQWISIKKNINNKIELGNIKLEYLGKSNERILLGNLKGNKFRIRVKNLSDDNIKNAERVGEELNMPNYFGEQRFSKSNEHIGELIIKRKFREAVDELSKENQNIQEAIKENPKDYLGALRSIPRQNILMYIHSFQSYLFNEALSRIIKLKSRDTFKFKISRWEVYSSDDLGELCNQDIPILGFGTEDKGNKENSLWKEALNIEKDLLNSRNIKEEDFLIRSAPDLSVEGTSRKAVITIKNINIKINTEKKDGEISFELPKGSYATVALKQIFKE